MDLSTRVLVSALSGFVVLASVHAADTPLVNHGDIWRSHKGTNAPQASWQTIADASLNATWATSTGAFGYANNVTETNQCRTLLTDMQNNYTTFYVRKSFSIASAVNATNHLKLTMDFDDGFIAWLDGAYLTNRFVTGAPAEPISTATANTSHESNHGDSGPSPVETYDFGSVGSRLSVGTHVLAIMGLNQTSGSTDFILIPDLSYGPPPPPITNTWYASNSPIAITTNVTIPDHTTLIIEPGVTVQFGAGINLAVANGGRLLAEGTSNAPIHFTRSGVSGFWGNITVGGDVETRIAYARFDFNANSTATPCLQVTDGTVYFDHLTFGNTAAPYVHLDGASFLISACEFPNTTAGFELVHGTQGIKAGGRGIIRDCFFGSATGYNDVVDFTGGNRNQGEPIVQFYNNVFMGTADDVLDLDGTDAWVEGNIFLHVHKNGAPDSSSAVSGGNTGSDYSEVTVIGNLFFDCDNAATAKQSNFFAFINNTIVHQSHAGGLDSTGGVVNVRDLDPGPPTTFGRGFYLEGNIILDAEQLVRNYDGAQTSVTLSNNILPFAWAGPGGNNTVANPLLKHVPLISETTFTNWAQAQIMWDWFSLQTNSPGKGTGPNGRDKGGVIPYGASISGEPVGTTSQSNATLTVGTRRTITGPSATGWPNGLGFTHYQWRLDGGAWSAETPTTTPITLANLAGGAHHVDVIGKNDAGFYQDDAALGTNAVITVSRTWTVGEVDTDGDGIPDSWETAYGLNRTNANDATLDADNDGMNNLQEYLAGTNPTNAASRLALSFTPPVAGSFTFRFDAVSNRTYTVQHRTSLSTGAWLRLQDVVAVPNDRLITVTNSVGGSTRFFQVVTPMMP